MASPSSNETDTLLELETGFWNAAGTGDFYREHMAAHGLCVLPVGILDKDDTVSAVAGAAPWQGFNFDDVRMLDLSHDVAALCYRATASRETHEYSALISSVYTRTNGRWMLTLHQQTAID